MSRRAKLITSADDVVLGRGMIMALLRADVAAALARKLGDRLAELARISARRSIWSTASNWPEAEHRAFQRARLAAEECAEAVARAHYFWDKPPTAEEVFSFTRKIMNQVSAAKRLTQTTIRHELTGDARKLWETLERDASLRSVLDLLGADGFESLLKHTRINGTAADSILGRLLELTFEGDPDWLRELTEAGERSARAIVLLPERDRWHFHYTREEIKAAAFANARVAGIPAPLLESLPIEDAAKDIQFSGVCAQLLKATDKSAWLMRDYGDWQIGLPMLLAESKGRKSVDKVGEQFARGLERMGLVVAEVTGKPTLVVLTPALLRPRLVPVAPRKLTKEQLSKIGELGAEAVVSLPHPVPYEDAHAFSKRLETLLNALKDPR